jgi:NADH-quinone oxidoreductase subunit M
MPSLALYLLILLPVLAAAAIGFKAPARPVALLTSTAMVFLVAWICHSFDPAAAGFQLAASLPVLDDPALALAVGIDGMSLVLVILSVLVLLCALWTIDPAHPQARLQYAGSLLIGAGALGSFVSTDLVFFFAFHELALIPTFLLIGLCGRGPEAKAAAWKITIYLGAASLVLLVGLIGLWQSLGESGFSIPDLIHRAAADPIPADNQSGIALLLLIGFGTLVSLVPLHSWAAPAYAAAPPPVAMLHAGVLKKFGLYGLLRLAVPLLPEGMREWAPWLLVLLLGNILFMGLVTIAQRRLDRLLGASSVMHMGYIFLAIATLALAGGDNQLAFNGAVLLMFAHGVSIALMFALAGRIEQRTGTLETAALGGLGKLMPGLGFLFGIGAMATLGLPGLANFPGELLVFLGAFRDFDPVAGLQALHWTTIGALWGVVISAVYMLRAYRSAFMGEPWAAGLRLAPLTTDEKLPLAVLAATLVLVGIFPNLILQYLPA